MLVLGERTQWGEVSAVGVLNGECYYWFVSEGTNRLSTGVSMLPASMVERVNSSTLTRLKGPAVIG
jgi:hypothetical protein